MPITPSIFLLLFVCYSNLFAGFSAETLIKTNLSYIEIEQTNSGDVVTCMHSDATQRFNKITHKHAKTVQRYVTITLDEDSIVTTLDQKFFLPLENTFKQAHQLKVDDVLLAYSGEHIPLRDIITVDQEKEFFEISVHECHNFFVSRSEILVHNVAPIVIGLSWLFGEGAVQFIGASVGTALLGTAVGIKMHRDKEHENQVNFCTIHEEYDNSWHANDAQAPGKPTANDGYEPPKNWDGKKVKHPKTGQHGYPDKKGNVWVPSGPNGHGGPHWDVVDKKGDYDNIVPGGGIRGKKK